MKRAHLAAGLVAVTLPTIVLAEDATIVHLAQNATRRVYWEVNLAGIVWLSIRRPDRSLGCADFYWKTYPLFRRIPVGERCGHFKLELPGLSNFSLGAALFATATRGEVKIVGSSSESVAVSIPVDFVR